MFERTGAAVCWKQVKALNVYQPLSGTFEISFMLPLLEETDWINYCFFSYFVQDLVLFVFILAKEKIGKSFFCLGEKKNEILVIIKKLKNL